MASPAAGTLAAKVDPRWLLSTGPVIVAAGFLLTLRIGSTTNYWLGVFPAMAVIALGMACAVAPLTTAVLMSVDSSHTGAASGLNSAVARTGGMVATALIGPVIASSGPALLSAFWYRCSDGRGRLRGSSGERYYVDLVRQNPAVTGTMMTVASFSPFSNPKIPSRQPPRLNFRGPVPALACEARPPDASASNMEARLAR